MRATLRAPLRSAAVVPELDALPPASAVSTPVAGWTTGSRRPEPTGAAADQPHRPCSGYMTWGIDTAQTAKFVELRP